MFGIRIVEYFSRLPNADHIPDGYIFNVTDSSGIHQYQIWGFWRHVLFGVPSTPPFYGWDVHITGNINNFNINLTNINIKPGGLLTDGCGAIADGNTLDCRVW